MFGSHCRRRSVANMVPKGICRVLLATSVLLVLVQGIRVKRAAVLELENGTFTTVQPLMNPEEKHEGLTDMAEIIQEYSALKNTSDRINWRDGLKFSEALTYMLNTSKLTDCSFVVGTDGKTERFEAHAVILSAASPVFELALENATSFRVKDWQPSEFRKVLSFIYSGDLCFKDFDEACTLLKLASSLGLDSANEAARGYISYNMYPNRLWHAFQCAKQAADEKLLGSVSKLISASTADALKDPKFYDISREDLSNLLARDDLAITSEFELFEAVTRWGLKQVTKEGLKPTPELIREKLGPDVIKNIRFLTMTGPEFSRLHISAKILDYEEGLAVLLYINNPGGLEMPKTLSAITTKRKSPSDAASTFQSLNIGNDKCEISNGESSDYYDYFTTTIIPNDNEWRLAGIQIPNSIEAKLDCVGVKEHFDVLILNSNNKVVQKFTYDQVPPCSTERFTYRNHYGVQSNNDNQLISVKFSTPVTIPRVYSEPDRYKVKIVFYDAKVYPKWVESGDSTSSPAFFSHGTTNFMGEYGFNFRVLRNKAFVYAMVLK